MTHSLTMFTRYGELGASSRHRFYHYAPGLREAGYEVGISPFFDDAYLRELYAGRRPSPGRIADAYYRRLLALSRTGKSSVWLIEYELLPFWPWAVERFFLRRRNYILNFDDNVWEKYDGKPLLCRKFDALTANAAGVVVANRFLEEKVRPLNPNLICVPTALDPAPYRQPGRTRFDRFTLVWIGTPVTYPYLAARAEMWRRLAQRIDFELLVIATAGLEQRALPGVNMRFVDWSEAAERELIGRAHLGVMPLPDDEFARGKSSFKLLQYFAAEIPAVASPVGENRRVIRDGVNGFLADGDDEWIERIAALAEDAGWRDKLASGASATAAEYSLATWVPRVIEFIEKTVRQ